VGYVMVVGSGSKYFAVGDELLALNGASVVNTWEHEFGPAELANAMENGGMVQLRRDG
jgi:hypothetical protein